MPNKGEPLETRVDGGNAHDSRGRFAPGNKLGRGNPLAGRAAKIRAALLNAATEADVDKICRKLIDGAKSGDLAFIKEFLDRTTGKACDLLTEERLDAVEASIDQHEWKDRR